ncbi:MAG: ATP-binding cassette domain-containing protein [Bacteroidales bacterium]
MGMDGIIAETTDLAIGYRNRKRVATVMKGLTLRARHGELVALIGRNGTGKSTLLRTLAGIQPSLAGEILIEGSPLSGLVQHAFPGWSASCQPNRLPSGISGCVMWWLLEGSRIPTG